MSTVQQCLLSTHCVQDTQQCISRFTVHRENVRLKQCFTVELIICIVPISWSKVASTQQHLDANWRIKLLRFKWGYLFSGSWVIELSLASYGYSPKLFWQKQNEVIVLFFSNAAKKKIFAAMLDNYAGSHQNIQIIIAIWSHQDVTTWALWWIQQGKKSVKMLS